MNWMGGSLSKSRHARGSVVARQKQHFAKLRNGASNKKLKGSPFEGVGKTGRGDQECALPPDSGGFDKFTSRLPGYDEPAIHDYPEFQDAQSTHPNKRALRNLTPRYDRDEYADFAHQHSPICKKEPADDIYDATPPPKSMDKSSVGPGETQNAYETLHERKRRLLRQHEWVGASVLRPLRLKHQQTQNTDRFAKRRKVSEHHEAKYGARVHSRVISPFATHRQNLYYDLQPENVHCREKPAERRKDVRIIIGGRQVAVGRSSSGIYGSGLHENSLLSQKSSSDVMLLDRDDMNPARGTVQGTYYAFDTAPKTVGQVEDHYVQCNSNGFLQRSPPFPDVSGSATYSKLRPDYYQRNTPRHPHPKAYYIAKDHSSDGIYEAQIMSEQAKLSLPGQDRGQCMYRYRETTTPRPLRSSIASGQHELQTLRPRLIHPIPVSSKTSRILRQRSDGSGSMVVNSGGVPPVVPSSQVQENEVWKEWLSQSDDQGHTAWFKSQVQSDKEDQKTPSIQAHISADNRLRDRSQLIDPCAVAYGAKEGPTPAQASSRDIRSESATPAETEIDYRNTFAARTWGSKTHNVVKSWNCRAPGPQASESAPMLSKKTGVAESPEVAKVRKSKRFDPDKVWMRFVFTSDDEEEVDELAPAASDFCVPEVTYSPKSSLCVETSMLASSSTSKELARVQHPTEQVSSADSCLVQCAEGSLRRDISSHDTEDSLSSSPDPLSIMV